MKRLLYTLLAFSLSCSQAYPQAQTLPTLPPAGTPYTGSELLYCVQGGISSKCLVSALGGGIGTIANLTVTGSFLATGLVTNADLVNTGSTVNGIVCTLGSSCTVTAAAGTVTGTTLAANVVTSSLTSLGTLGLLNAAGDITSSQVIGAVSTDGLSLSNPTAAASGAQKWAPRVHWTGQGWKTNATAGSQTVDIIEELQPVQGAANPTGNLVWSSQVNGAGYSVLLTLSTGGGLNLASGNYQIAGSQIAFSNIASSLACAQTPAQTGDVTSPAGSCATTVAKIQGVTVTAPTGTGAVVLGTSPSIASPTITGAFAATGLVTNADLASPSTTVNGQTCTLGSSCSTAGATSLRSPANPTGTSNTTGVMMGLAGSITPATTGKIIIIINGTMQNDTQGDGCGVSIYTGTGSAPSNGAATTGTSRGASTVANQAQPGNTFFQFPFSIAAVVTGLSAGTTYWIDANMGAISGGTCTMLSPNITAAEL